MFGVYDASGFNRAIGGALGTETETNRRHFEDRMRNLSIQGARAQFGKGSLAAGKAEFIREGLPHLGDASAQAAYDALEEQQRAAKGIIDQYGGAAPQPVDSAPLPPPHPFQGAPAPQPAVNAGEVPRPAQAGPGAVGDLPMPNDADTRATFTPEAWAALPPAMKQAWIRNDTR
jgi:hypothetical protein